LFVQYSPDATLNPITQAGFSPGATDRWSEIWFPLEGTGGLSDASREGAMAVELEEGTITVRVNAFSEIEDTLTIRSGDQVLGSVPVSLEPLEVWEHSLPVSGSDLRVTFPRLNLDYAIDPVERQLARPFTTDPVVRVEIPAADRLAFEARELAKARRYRGAAELFEDALDVEPWHRIALLGMADLESRRGRFEEGLTFVQRALQLDAYDAEANFVAGNLYRGAGMNLDARGAYGWAIRSPEFRSAGYIQLAELAMQGGEAEEAARYANFAMDYDRYNLSARQILTMLARQKGDSSVAALWHRQMLEIDPLHHFVAGERALASPEGGRGMEAMLRSEYPEQSVLELAVDYHRRGAGEDAARLLDLVSGDWNNPVVDAWRGWLANDASIVSGAAAVPFAFPYRPETLPVLDWAVSQNDHWSWSYLKALNLWALDRHAEAAELFQHIGEEADYGPFYVARAVLFDSLALGDGEADLRKAVELAGEDRTIRIQLVRYYLDHGRWEDALEVSGAGRERFPGDFNLDLLHVSALNQLGRIDEAMQIIDAAHVLPSESGRESHRLFAQAHTLAGLRSLESGNARDALAHLNKALEWPERLGQGRPYEPEERLVQFLIGAASVESGDRGSAEAAFESVIAATPLDNVGSSRGDLLALLALGALNQGLDNLTTDENTDVGRMARAVIRATQRGLTPSAGIRSIVGDFGELFADLDGRSLKRAMLVTP
jgi:tetratricopeptide (TPR) repeat protein